MPTPLFAQLMQPETLAMAWEQVRRGGKTPGVDDVTLPQFERHLDRELPRLAREVREGAYHPWPSLRLNIPKLKGGTRAIGIQCVRDRVVQRALLNLLQPRIEPQLEACSYAFRPGRSVAQALSTLDALHQGGRSWAARGDIRLCFDSLAHDRLQAVLSRVVPEKDVQELLSRWLRAGVVDGEQWQETGAGVVQGDALSPLLCNLYLDAFDETLLRAGYALIRYADDFVLLAHSEREARRGLQAADTALSAIALHSNPEKAWVGTFIQGFEYLGASLVGSLILPLHKVERPGKLPRYTFGYGERPPVRAPNEPPCAPVVTPLTATHAQLREELLRLRRARQRGRQLPAVGAAMLQAWEEAGRRRPARRRTGRLAKRVSDIGVGVRE